MGLLKHVLLPTFGLFHAASVAACYDLKTWASMIGLSEDSVSKDDETSVRQNHMLGAIRGLNVAMMALCGMGIFKEHAHFRAQIILAEAALFSTVAYDAFRLGGLKKSYMVVVPAVQALVALGGFIINSMEPGIFTKDKNM